MLTGNHGTMRSLAVVVMCLVAQTACALDAKGINDAQWSKQTDIKGDLSPAVVKAQILLDRAHFSPGEIDGKFGENFKKAISVFSAKQGGTQTGGDLSEDVWRKLVLTSGEPVLTEYSVTEEDVRGPFLQTIPSKMEEMKDLPSLGYTSPREKLAEKFHMSQDLLAALNPEQKFAPGERIIVHNITVGALDDKAARLEVNKSTQVLRAFSKDGKLIAVYPVTAGSEEKPAPSGTLKVVSVSKNPFYRYNPEYAFKGVRSQRPFTIKPGPNNPVGLAWIGLSAKGYGIHGTPDPSKVSKSESHGCIRLTNWDVLQLSSIVAKGTVVDFVGDEQIRHRARPGKTSKRRR
jgi:lipoprotein-anchoring transpeptidase ErfK/SrfK